MGVTHGQQSTLNLHTGCTAATATVQSDQARTQVCGQQQFT
jgi:hypothetical protein